MIVGEGSGDWWIISANENCVTLKQWWMEIFLFSKWTLSSFKLFSFIDQDLWRQSFLPVNADQLLEWIADGNSLSLSVWFAARVILDSDWTEAGFKPRPLHKQSHESLIHTRTLFL